METIGNQFFQSIDSGPIGMVIRSGPMAKGVLLSLLIFSIISWSIMLQKIILFWKAQQESEKFLEVFQKRRRGLNYAYTSGKLLKNSYLAKLFIAGYLDVASLQKYRRESKSPLEDDAQSLQLDDLQSLKRALNRTESQEVSRFEKNLGFLATTGSATPFIGLFGTVWGIMDAFRSIGIKGSASIAAVAPGISEALIATAAGLAAAIPAVIGFNYFNNKIRNVASEMDEFSLEFISLIERSFIKKR